MAKLVRDRIPEIIAATGRIAATRILDKDEYLEELRRKLEEETEEFLKEDNLEELADILEVLRALTLAKGYSIEELEEERRRKALERGIFKERILLENVIDENYGL